MNICFMIPCGKTTETNFMFSVFSAMSYLKSKGHHVEVAGCIKSPIHVARNFLAKQVCGKPFDYVLMLDNDHVFGALDVENLLNKAIDGNYDVLAANYYMRGQMPFVICGFMCNSETKDYSSVDHDKTGIIEVDATGYGFAILKQSVFDFMVKKYDEKLFDYYIRNTEDHKTEDFIFSENLKESGYKIHLDMDLHIKHIGFSI